MDDSHDVEAGDVVEALLSLDELAQATGLHPDQIESFVRFGLVEPAGGEAEIRFSVAAIDRLRTIVRLRRDLGVNLAGVAAILEMRDHMADLQRELQELRRRLGLGD